MLKQLRKICIAKFNLPDVHIVVFFFLRNSVQLMQTHVFKQMEPSIIESYLLIKLILIKFTYNEIFSSSGCRDS